VSSPEVGRIRPGAVGVRLENGLKLMLPIAPRTKKNGSALGIRQSDAYRYFRDRVKEMLAPLKTHLGLPLAEARTTSPRCTSSIATARRRTLPG
jgi:hypothetical protein